MSTVPSNPVIYQQPTIYDNTIQYYWRPPVSNGGSNILGYYIECNTIPLTVNVVADKFWQKVGGLTNGRTYTFHVKAYNSVGNGNVSVFPDATPGKKTLPPSNIDFTMNVSNVLDLNWVSSATDNFHPKNIEGLKLWLDATDSSNIILSNSNVTTWLDKSEFRYTFNQSNIAKSPFIGNINGLNAIQFSGLSNTNSTFLSNSLVNFNNTKYSIFAVACQDTVSPSGFNYLLKGGELTRNYYLQLGSRDGLFATYTGNSGGWNDTTTNLPSSNIQTNSILSMNVNGSTLTPYFNGNVMTTKTGTTITSMNSISFNNNYTLLNMTQNNNTFTSTNGGGSAWNNSKFVSLNAYQYFSATVRFASLSYAQFGVAYSNTATYGNLNYFFYFDSNYGIDCRTSTYTTVAGPISYTTSDIFRIVYDGLSVKYYKNNDIIAQSVVTLTGPVYLVSEIFAGSILDNVIFEELAPANKIIGMTIGDAVILDGYNWNGRLGELLIYDTILTPETRNRIEGYLANKWKLTNNLTDTHPYKITKPTSEPIFNPTHIGNLNFWLDATKFKHNSNSTVYSSISELSMNGITGTFFNSPTWINNAINNLPAFSFNGSTQYLSFPNSSFYNLNSSITIFVVGKFLNNGGIVSKSRSVAQSGRWAINRDSSGLNFLIDTTGVTANTITSSDSNSFTYDTQIINASWDSSNMFLFQNGECKRVLSNPSNTSYTNSNNLLIGVSASSTGTGPLAGTYLRGYIGEILIYNKQLNDIERQTVDSYLAQKWGITNRLDSYNVFKNSIVNNYNTITPTLIPSCAAWYDGSDPLNNTGTLTHGMQIERWHDKSGNYRHATQTITQNKPTYLSGGGIYFNSNFQQFLQMNVPYTDNHSIFLVATPSNNSNTYYFARSTRSGSSPSIISNYGYGTEYYNSTDRFTLNLNNNILNNISSNVSNISADTFLTINNSLILPSTSITYTSNSTYTVPYGITGLLVRIWGAGGGNVSPSITGGAGAYVEGIIDVRSGEVYSIYVGEGGTYNGSYGTGGGLTGIYKTNTNAPICIAGSGGGAGGSNFGGVATVGSMSYSGGSSYENQVLGAPAYPGSEGQNGGGATQTANGIAGYFYGTKATGGAGFYTGGAGGEQYNGDGAGGAGSSLLGGLAFTLNSANGNGITGGNNNSIYRINNAGDAGNNGLVIITPIYRTTKTETNTFIASYTKQSLGTICGYFNGEPSNPYTSIISNGSEPFDIIGNSSNDTNINNFLNGTIYEFIIYNKILAKDERELIEGYLAWKWGLTNNLPSIHPYKNTRPTPKTFLPGFGNNLNLWIDASDSSTINSANSKISYIFDKSGKNYNLDQYDNRYKPEIANSLISFKNNYFLNMPFLSINNASTWVLFLVIRPKAPVNYIMQKLDTSVGSYNLLSMTNLYGETAGNNYYMYFSRINGGTTSQSLTRLASNNLQIIRIYFNGTQIFQHINGVQVSSSTSNYAIPDKQTGTCFTLGAWTNLSTFTAIPSNFELAEMLFYNSSLYSGVYFQIEGYLAEKWNIKNYLLNTIPFSNFSINNPNIIVSESPRNYVVDNIVKIMPVDVRGNLITNDSGNTIVNTMRGTFNSKSYYISNNNWSYKASLISTSNIGHSDVAYTSTIFNPKIPSDGLKLWLDSYDTSTLTLSNNLVVKWNDKSKNFSNAIVNISNSPDYDSANNLINFNGNQYLVLPNNTITSGNVDYTMFIYSVTSNVNKLQWPLYSGTSLQNQSLGINYNNSNIYHSWYLTESFSNQPIYPNIGTVSSYTYSNGFANIYVNGYLVSTNRGNIRNTSTGNNYIGTDSSFANSLVGSIGDILVYNRLLTNTERQSVEDYLKKRRTIFNTANLLVWIDASSFSANIPNILLDKTYNGFNIRPQYGNISINTSNNGIVFDGNTCLQISDANVISNPINDGLTIISSNISSPRYYKLSFANTSNIGNSKITINYDVSNLNITGVSLKDLYYPSNKFIPSQVSGNLNTGIYLTNNDGFKSNIILNNPLDSTDPMSSIGWTPTLYNMVKVSPSTYYATVGNNYDNKVTSIESFKYFTATVNLGAPEYAYFGFAYNTNGNQTTMNYGFSKSSYPSTISVYESNNNRYSTNYSGELMTITYDGTSVKYYMGNTLIYTSLVPVTGPLYLYFTIWQMNQQLTDISVVGYNGSLNITYESPSNGWTPVLYNFEQLTLNNFRNLDTSGSYNNKVTSLEGYQNFKANVNLSFVEFAYYGMTYNTNTVNQYNMNYGFFKNSYPSTISVIEENNYRTTLNYSGEIMSIEYNGSNINYYQNDTLIYTSNVTVTNNMYLYFSTWGMNQEIREVNFGGNIISSRNHNRIPLFTTSNISISTLPEYTTSIWFNRKGLCGINSALIADSNSSNSLINMAMYTTDGSNFRGGYIDNNFWTSNLANITLGNNTYTKNAVGNSWYNSKLVSNESFYQPNATVSFTFAEYAVFGLAYDNNKSFYDETNIDYALKYDVYSGVTSVIENGNVRANISNDTSSIFSVRSFNGNIIYSKDNTVFYTSNVLTNNKLYLVMNIWADNNYVSNVKLTDQDSLQRTGNIVSFPLNEWHNMTITVNNSFIKTYYDGNISNIYVNKGNISSSNNLLTIGGSINRVLI